MDDKLRITTDENDVLDIWLTIEKTPIAYNRKMKELVESSGMTKEEAEQHLAQSPIPLELLYHIGLGLFGVESEAMECSEIYSPYTGEEIPNDNLPTSVNK